ncbi:hypothetical protein B5F40_14365 [Gordonibacter sp. An230]|uniref:hypothetical protein n=1 Tax=Gordonibacter sp. An230 TaxID=1965592 RepID=UPI000B3AFA67|nr:hypothetical protein [Gordonibacter sp. An230]OUO86979.1 hypothetical protein B5F40_14365 [Gordonibacter sp. An230]
MNALDVFRFFSGEFENAGTLKRMGQEAALSHDQQYLADVRPDPRRFASAKKQVFRWHELKGL